MHRTLTRRLRAPLGFDAHLLSDQLRQRAAGRT